MSKISKMSKILNTFICYTRFSPNQIYEADAMREYLELYPTLFKDLFIEIYYKGCIEWYSPEHIIVKVRVRNEGSDGYIDIGNLKKDEIQKKIELELPKLKQQEKIAIIHIRFSQKGAERLTFN